MQRLALPSLPELTNKSFLLILLCVHIFKTHTPSHVNLFDMSGRKRSAQDDPPVAPLDAEGKAMITEILELQREILHNCTVIYPVAVVAKRQELEAKLLDTTFAMKQELENVAAAERKLTQAHEVLAEYAKLQDAYGEDYDAAMKALRPYRDSPPPTP